MTCGLIRTTIGNKRVVAVAIGLVGFSFGQAPRGCCRAWAQNVGSELPPISREELFANWRALQRWDEAAKSYHATTTATAYGRRKRTSVITYNVKMQPEHRLVISTSGEGGSVFARSPRYGFLLARPDSRAQWSMRQFSMDLRNPEWIKVEQSGGVWASFPLSVFNERVQLTQLVDDPAFKILRISRVNAGLDKVEFEYNKISGYLLTDRNHSSLVIESHFRHLDYQPVRMSELRRQLFAEPGKDGVPKCKSIQYVKRDTARNVTTEEISMQFTDYSFDAIPAEEYQLSHYGLPEPIGMEPTDNRSTIKWLLLGATALVILAILLWRITRRRKSTAA